MPPTLGLSQVVRAQNISVTFSMSRTCISSGRCAFTRSCMASNYSVRLIISYVQEEDTTVTGGQVGGGIHISCTEWSNGNRLFTLRYQIPVVLSTVRTGSFEEVHPVSFFPNPKTTKSSSARRRHFCLAPSRDETNHHESPHRDRLPPHRLIDGGKWIRPRRCEGSRELRGMAKLGRTAKVATSSRQRKITFDKC